jgi:hypothetical protein
MFDYVEMARDTCYHEAAHAVFVHHQPGLQLRYVEVHLEPEDGRQDFTFFSGTRTFPDTREAMDYAVLGLVGEYAVYRARPDDKRTGYKSFEEFMEDADPEDVFRDLNEYDNLHQLYIERLRYLRNEEEWERYQLDYSGDKMDALVDLRLVTGLARSIVEEWPSLEQIPGGQDFLRWRELRSCYADATQRAFEFLDKRWPEINAVAERLMEVGHLDGSEVCRIVESVSEEKNDI